jgi:hypothetical protein
MVEVETISTTRHQISILRLTIDSLVDLRTLTIATLSQFHLLAGSHHHQERAVLLEVLHRPLQDTVPMVEVNHKLRIHSLLATDTVTARLDMLMIVVEAGTLIGATVGVETLTEDNIGGPVKEWASRNDRSRLIDSGGTFIESGPN